jgi:hypothetical protein
MATMSLKINLEYGAIKVGPKIIIIIIIICNGGTIIV